MPAPNSTANWPSVWHEPVPGADSLAACLAWLLADAPPAPDTARIQAELALPWLVTAVPDEPLAVWDRFNRDEFLIDVAAQHGLRLRELHPPDAAEGLAASPEFDAHFHDSYVPLIERALQHGQAALAWRGWPAPQGWNWGVIVGQDAGGLYGHVPGPGADPVHLAGPALQVYIAEERRAAPAPLTDVLGALAQRVARIWHAGRSARRGVLVGSAAYTAWGQRLRAGRSADRNEPSIARQHAGAMGRLAALRAAAVELVRSESTDRALAATLMIWFDKSAAVLQAPTGGIDAEIERIAALEAVDRAFAAEISSGGAPEGGAVRG